MQQDQPKVASGQCSHHARRIKKARLSCGNPQLSDNTPAASTNTSLEKQKFNVNAGNAFNAGSSGVQDVYVQCFLNVSSAMHAKDGFVCVSIQTSCTRSKNTVKQVQNIYAAPQHLRLVKDDDEAAQSDWVKALKYIIV